MNKGFSLVELILVIAILGIIASASAPFYARFVGQNNLEVATNKIVSTIRKTQSYAMEGKDNAVWGFCMSSGKIRLFKGSCASPTFTEEFDLDGVGVTGISETLFTGPAGKRGEPSTTLNINITNDIGTKTVTLNALGGMDIN